MGMVYTCICTNREKEVSESDQPANLKTERARSPGFETAASEQELNSKLLDSDSYQFKLGKEYVAMMQKYNQRPRFNEKTVSQNASKNTAANSHCKN